MPRLLALTLVFMVFAGVTRAQDPLDQASRELSLKAQKVVRDVNLSLGQARARAQTSPKQARDILRDSKLLLENDDSLPETQRRDLLRRVNNALRDLGVVIAEQDKAREIAAAQRFEDNLGRDPKKGNGGEKGPAAVAKGRIGSTQDVLAKVDHLRAQRERGVMGVLGGIEAAATPFDGVIEYPKYWARITEMRKQKLDPREAALLKALNSTLSVDFKNTPFSEVIDYLQEKTGQPIIIDENSLKDLMIESSDPVTFKVNKVTFRTILRKVLADRGLSYILAEGTIQVVSAQKARETTVVRAYPVSDLVGGNSPMFFNPFMQQAVMQQNALNLINMVTQAVEPSYWQVNGGPGTIAFEPRTMSLVIRASAEMHYMFGGTGMFGR